MSCGNHLLLFLGVSLLLLLNGVSSSINYGDALTKSLLYFEAQRSGKLPANQRVQWRGDSGLKDGGDAEVDLVGGYYDAGDNVKHGFPMAFTITMLAWSATEFHRNLIMKNELSHTLEAIKWGTDYLIKAHPQPNVFYGEVGDADSDHDCWQRPEDMTTPRPSFKIDEAHPGSDLAGESAAALAAAAIAFSDTDPNYSKQLLIHAKQLFEFAKNYQGLYQTSIPVVAKYYSSSGFQDELLWAAAWLHLATNDKIYLDYLASTPDTGGIRTMFSWDDKFVGAQTLVARLVLEQQVESSGIWNDYKSQAEAFICTIIDKGASQGKKTPGGLKWWQPFNNLQYTTSAMFILTAYSAYLTTSQKNLSCPNGNVDHEDLIVFVHSQAGYILGSNPKSLSYMVGFGPNYPKKVHHRGASIVSIKNDPTTVTCKGGFDWFNKDSPNPNVIDGAIVGGPDLDDSYTDSRSNFLQAQAATVTTAPFVGVLARLST